MKIRFKTKVDNGGAKIAPAGATVYDTAKGDITEEEAREHVRAGRAEEVFETRGRPPRNDNAYITTSNRTSASEE